jgi:ABC-type sugar transport system permease subunit
MLRAGHVFVAGYVLLLIAFGVVPTGYAIYFAFTNAQGGWAGLHMFAGAAHDFRYLPAIGHVAGCGDLGRAPGRRPRGRRGLRHQVALL